MKPLQSRRTLFKLQKQKTENTNSSSVEKSLIPAIKDKKAIGNRQSPLDE